MAEDIVLPPLDLAASQYYPKSDWDAQFETEMRKAVKEFLEDEFAQSKIEEFPIWSMVTKTSKITFLDRTELSIFESHLESMLCSYYMSVPPCMQNDDMYQLADQVRMLSKFNLRRSSGTENANKINERTIHATQFRQSFSSGQGNAMTAGKPGLLKRMFGMG
jgi:hypothetical protein